MKKHYTSNASRDIKIGDSIRITTENIINHYGKENCSFITIGIAGNNSLKPIASKYSAFIKKIGPDLRTAVSVFGIAENSMHIHIVGVFLPPRSKRATKPFYLNSKASTTDTLISIPINKIRMAVKKAKAQAGFGRVFKVDPIHKNAEAVGGYLRRNFLELDEIRKYSGYFRGAGLKSYRFHGVPDFLKVSPKQFSRHTPTALRYRLTMSRFATCVGTPVGDLSALESTTGLTYKMLRSVAFGICNSKPGNLMKLNRSVFENALFEAGSTHNLFNMQN